MGQVKGHSVASVSEAVHGAAAGTRVVDNGCSVWHCRKIINKNKHVRFRLCEAGWLIMCDGFMGLDC
jgi:hypothetical protein